MEDEIPRLEGESLLEYARRRAQILGLDIASTQTTQTQKPEPPSQNKYYDPDLVPDDPTPERFKRERLEVDAVLGRLDIVDAYNLYCKKMQPKVDGRRESIMVSCPFPGHEDRHPSAWLNLDKGDGGVGNCASCGGFDKYDMAAWHYGFDVPGYKEGKNFPELRLRMAEGLGYTVMVAGKDQWLEKIQPPESVASSQLPVEVAPSPAPVDAPPQTVIDLTKVISLPVKPEPEFEPEYEYEEDGGVDDRVEGLDWRTLPFVLPDTFLHTWMTETSRAHQPEEFYLFEGFAALALAVGPKVILDDEDNVRPNTMICLVGGTGTGKSRSVNKFNELLRQGMPFQESNAGGIKFIYSPGSGEDLVNQMIYYTTDPVTKEVTYYPVRSQFQG